LRVSTATLLTFALLVVMMVTWTFMIRYWRRKTDRSAKKLAELEREVREAERAVLDGEDWDAAPRA
jgi:preprotein translocase subunit YajC